MGETKVILTENEENIEIQIPKIGPEDTVVCMTATLQQALFIKEEIAKILHDLEIRKEIMNIFPESLKLHLYKLMDVKEMTFDRVGDTYGMDKSDHDLFRIRVVLNDGQQKEYCRQIAFGTDLETFEMQMSMIPEGIDVYFTNAGILNKWLVPNSATDTRKTYRKDQINLRSLRVSKDYILPNEEDDYPIEDLVAATYEDPDVELIFQDSLEEEEDPEPKKVIGVSEFVKGLIGKNKQIPKPKTEEFVLDSPTSELLNLLKKDTVKTIPKGKEEDEDLDQ